MKNAIDLQCLFIVMSTVLMSYSPWMYLDLLKMQISSSVKQLFNCNHIKNFY